MRREQRQAPGPVPLQGGQSRSEDRPSSADCRALKGLLFASALVAAAGAPLSPLAAQELTGQWLFQTEFGGASLEERFVFEVDSGVITGTYEGLTGKHIVTGTIEGNVAKFVVRPGSGVGEFRYEGTIEGDTMEGTLELVGSSFDVAGGDYSGTFVGSRSSR